MNKNDQYCIQLLAATKRKERNLFTCSFSMREEFFSLALGGGGGVIVGFFNRKRGVGQNKSPNN